MRKDLISRGLQGAESRLALLLVLMMLGLSANAQLPKFARVTADGVNIRKSPSASAPKLLSVETEFEYTPAWSDESLAKGNSSQPFQILKGSIVGVICSEGDWTKISIPGDYGIEEGWMSSRYLQEETVKPISLNEFLKNEWWATQIKRGGKYQGLVLNYPNEMDDSSELQFYNNGMMISLAQFGFSIDRDYEGKGIKIGKNEWNPEVWELKVGTDRRDNDGYAFDINKFTDQELELLLKTLCEKGKKPMRMSVFYKGNDGGIRDCSAKADCTELIPDAIKSLMGLPVSKPKEEVKSESSQPVEKKQELKKNPVADDRDASFPGGEDGLNAWIKFQLKYSKVKKKGSVTVAFDVDKTGSVRNVSIERSADPALDREAMRIVQMMPKWTPGIKNGQYEVFRKEITIDFK